MCQSGRRNHQGNRDQCGGRIAVRDETADRQLAVNDRKSLLKTPSSCLQYDSSDFTQYELKNDEVLRIPGVMTESTNLRYDERNPYTQSDSSHWCGS